MKRFPDAVLGHDRSIGYGYVGRWKTGEIGWFLPDHVIGATDYVEPPSITAEEAAKGEKFELCRIMDRLDSAQRSLCPPRRSRSRGTRHG
jgi:hypothetical protein